MEKGVRIARDGKVTGMMDLFNALNQNQETVSTLAMKKDCLSCEDVLQLLAQRSGAK